MEVYSLSGTSGTGKSTIALSFAHQKKIPAIIDDGLLIYHGQRIAGTSAKFEKNALTAVKRATFFDEDHLKEVKAAIANYYIGKILIIGTSDRMTKLIASKLELGEIKRFFHVEDIRTSNEMKMAQFVRKTEGKHVIPIPMKQVEQNFFKKLIHRGTDIFTNKYERIGETTIVTPNFQRGMIKIHQKVYTDIIKYICEQHRHIEKCDAVQLQLFDVPILKVSLILKQPITYDLIQMAENLQKQIHEHYLYLLHIDLYEIHLTLKMSKFSEKG